MYRNHADVEIPKDKYEAIKQYEWWRPGYERWKTLSELDTDHLQNLKNWLLTNAEDFYLNSGEHTGTLSLRRWMENQPLYLSVNHELQVRANKQTQVYLRMNAFMNEFGSPGERYFAFTGRKMTRTDFVVINDYDAMDDRLELNDAITETRLWHGVSSADFRQYSVEVDFKHGIPTKTRKGISSFIYDDEAQGY